MDALAAALAETDLKTPTIPVISNVDAAPHSDPAVIKDILAKQVTSPVLFRAETFLRRASRRGPP